MMEKLVAEITEQHGGKLDLKEHVYYLYLKDGMISLYFDEETKKLKVDVELHSEGNTFVYFSLDKGIADILGVDTV